MNFDRSMAENSVKFSMKTKIGYGAGAVLNVMLFTMINSYMLLFYHAVVNLSHTNAGLITLIGRIIGGLSSIIIGILADLDKDCWIYRNYGKRKVCCHHICFTY